MKKKKLKKMSYKEKLEIALRPLTDEQMQSLTKEELLIVLRREQKIRKFYEDIM